MTESGDDSSDMQNFLLRSCAINGLDFRRFQVSLDTTAIRKLPNQELTVLDDVKADWLWELTNEELADIPLDKVSLFPLMQVIGKAMIEYITDVQTKPFSADLIGTDGKELLVSRLGDVTRIRAQMSRDSWLDNYEA